MEDESRHAFSPLDRAKITLESLNKCINSLIEQRDVLLKACLSGDTRQLTAYQVLVEASKLAARYGDTNLSIALMLKANAERKAIEFVTGVIQ